MSSAGGIVLGIVLVIFGILFIVGSVAAWVYLAVYCGLTQLINHLNTCLTFYSRDQIQAQGLASDPPVVFQATTVLGFVLLILGAVLTAVFGREKKTMQ